MDLVKISLEALLERATNAQNQNIDTAAVEAFCALITKEKDGPLLGIKLLANRIHSKQEQEVLQTLHIIDYCLQKCGSPFQSEVGKFRFLNEMIKLVSPKYMGCHTAPAVKQKVLQLMYLWTLDYPKETKVKEAYDMLKKQGVIKEVPLSVNSESYNVPNRPNQSTIFQDEEKSKLLKKLLQSKNPEDLQAANRLIKSMVKEDEKKAELKSKRVSELESVQNNVRLLNEMLDSYKPGISSKDEYDLIKELHESCERLRPNIVKLASETQQNEEILGEILHLSDEMGQVFEKYTSIIVNLQNSSKEDTSQLSLLDITGHSSNNLILKSDNEIGMKPKNSTIDELCDILNTPNITESLTERADESILKPTSVNLLLDINGDAEKSNNKLKALEELDALGEDLLKENLQSSSRMGQHFNKSFEKVPMNLLSKSVVNKIDENPIDKMLNFADLLEKPKPFDGVENQIDPSLDDLLVDISEELPEKTEEIRIIPKSEVKLGDLFVDLKTIKPSAIAPINAMEERNGISVTFHFARDVPHDDVSVIVVTIVSKNELPLKNILFRAIVPKVCKVKLQAPSATDLPPFNPFLPASAITQVMLVANPEKVQMSLKFIVSYNIDDETLTEMGEVESLPAIPYL